MTAAARVSGEPGTPGRFACPSATVPGRVYYVIWVGPDLADCACKSFTYRAVCRHVKAVESLVRGELRERHDAAAAALEEIERMFAR